MNSLAGNSESLLEFLTISRWFGDALQTEGPPQTAGYGDGGGGSKQHQQPALERRAVQCSGLFCCSVGGAVQDCCGKEL